MMYGLRVRKMLAILTVLASVMVMAIALQNTVLVTLKQGQILGMKQQATNSFVYYSFNTIPYAMPPVGSLRFKDPQPGPTWNGVRDGSLPFPMCPQSSIFFMEEYSVKGQEDCLYLNVFTPKPYRSNLPVMVYIHGGAFVAGSATQVKNPALMVQKGVVMVVINYRLGALGFLSTGDSVLPGNMGLKDQNMALRWVQDNIHEMGGDPKRVTLYGVSAGGISTHIHILSPNSAGLFQRAILQSGTALMSSVFPPARKSAISISKALNCTDEESQQLLACFMKAPVKDLVLAQDAHSVLIDVPLTVGVQVDGTFLPESPSVLMKSGRYNKVDVIIGWTKDDSNILTTPLFSERGRGALQYLNENFEKAGPILLNVMDEDNPLYIARRVFLNYMSDLNITMEDEEPVTNILTGSIFESPGGQSAEFFAKNPHNKTFLYKLEHYLEKPRQFLTDNHIHRKLAGHGDDLVYMFQYLQISRPQDLLMQDIILTLWTNFVYTGNPTVNGTLGFRWTQLAPGKPLHYLSLTTSPSMQPLDMQTQDFWNSLPRKDNIKLYPEHFLEG